ncbi:MAG: hypothetical protein LBG52_01725 [Candidatus Peribacteria bacterium]|jgi:hypothetical protein|nr:hypothetical protein [Candidatus Peribacteria bacterium]
MPKNSFLKFAVEKVLKESLLTEGKKLSVYGDFLVKEGEKMRTVVEKLFDQTYDEVLEYLDTLPELQIVQKLWDGHNDREGLELQFS